MPEEPSGAIRSINSLQKINIKGYDEGKFTLINSTEYIQDETTYLSYIDFDKTFILSGNRDTLELIKNQYNAGIGWM